MTQKKIWRELKRNSADNFNKVYLRGNLKPIQWKLTQDDFVISRVLSYSG